MGRPEQHGFGLELITRQVTHAIGGDVEINFRREGSTATVTIPARHDLFG